MNRIVATPGDHEAAGYTVDDDGTPMSINVEMIGTGRVVHRARPLDQKADIIAGVVRDVLPLFAAGAIRAVVDTVVRMVEAGRAHELVEAKRTVGKVILDNGRVD
jgi:NADPH:quinone reductase-like Zn-dependent oxidoreductase